jgi:hypothetical protein
LGLLRSQVVGPDRFDDAFRKYIRDWAYKHPTPWDFFRSMENTLGEDLGWFWKGMFLENWRLDQAVSKVEYIDGVPAKGAIITIDNLEKMAMPLVVEYTTQSGTKTRKKFPVEIWQNNTSYKFRVNSTEELSAVVIDPDKAFPDWNPGNNAWNSGKNP